MTEQELRALVREAIKRHVAGSGSHTAPPAPLRQAPRPASAHPSHGTFLVPDGSEGEGACVIEPTVMCTHCGYCKSYGH